MSTHVYSQVKHPPAQAPSFTPANKGLLQRKCADDECRKKKLTLHRYSTDNAEPSTVPPIVHEVLRSPGQPLDPATRAFMEPRFGHDFARVKVRHQAKLKISQPDDIYEQEADQISDQVMRIGFEKGKKVTQCRENNLIRGFEVSGDIAREINSLHGRGSPLDPPTRAFMESRFGHDFSQVRVHSDARAANLARSINALAFTTGRDLVFETGQYIPGTDSGKRLLAHELAHVVQQDGHSTGLGIFRVSASMCAKPSSCAAPDFMGAGTASSWKLTLAVDKEEEGLGRLKSGNVGHTWVKLTDNTGTKYSYGFWPQTFFNSKRPFSPVAGCVHHPDILHEPPKAKNYIAIDYPLTEDKYLKALNYAQSICRTKPDYNLVTYNCTSFAIDVARAAEISPPSSTTLAIHNPNALYEGIKKKKEEGHTDVSVPFSDALHAASQEAAELAQRLEREASEAVERRIIREVASEAAETRIRRVFQNRFPRIISARLTRIAASRTARRAASLIPVLGWGFAGKDAYEGLRDIFRGNVARGLSGVGCAAVDVASDVLHLGDAVGVVKGTVKSITNQVGTTACQVAIEVSRAEGRMRELYQEIARTGMLPSDSRLRKYYDMDDEAIRELRAVLQQR